MNTISAEDRVIQTKFSLTRKERQRHALNFRFSKNQEFILGMILPETDLQVQVKTELGDSVYVTGSIVELGCWDHRNGLQLSTNASMYPMWTGTHMIPSGMLSSPSLRSYFHELTWRMRILLSGQWVKYKYVILQADGNVRWEGIPDRMFTPEGMNITLEDGHFDVERARLLNKNLVSVGGGDVGTRKNKGKMAGLDCLHSTAKIEAADTIYIMTYRLPLVTTRSPETVSHVPSSTAPAAHPRPAAPCCLPARAGTLLLLAFQRGCGAEERGGSETDDARGARVCGRVREFRGGWSSSGCRSCRTRRCAEWTPPARSRIGSAPRAPHDV